jgi:hypothetical protein
MAKVNIPEFLQNRNLLALKISSSEIGGLFTKKFTVPLGTVGLALFADGAITHFPEGKEVQGKFDLVLVKVGDIQVKFGFTDLRSSDGFTIGANLGILTSISTTRADLLKDFTRTLFTFPGVYAATDLKANLAPEAKKIVGDFVKTQAAADLHKRDRFADVERTLSDALERHLFGTGIRLERVQEIAFAAPEYEKHAAAVAKRTEDDRREKEKVEKKEERVKRLAAFLQEQSVQDLLAKIPDDRLKGLLYAKLMEDDSMTLSAQELLNKAGSVGGDMVQHLYKAMEGLLGGGHGVNPDEIEPENAEHILLAAGPKVFMIDSETGRVEKDFTFREALRSVRSVTLDKPAILAGSKRAVHAVLDGKEIVDFPLPDDRQPKGGVNAIAAHGRKLFATHSEFGVARWDAAKPGEPAEILFEDLTKKYKTTRAAQIGAGYLLFATGPSVYAVALGNGMHPIAYNSAVDSPVTSVVCGAGTLFAGTESGAIVSWKLGEPDKPAVLVRKKESIVNLRVAKVCSIPHLFYTTKDYAVRARVIGQNLETAYDTAGATVGVLDAASNFVAAGDAAGRRLLIWKAASPAQPIADIDAGRFADKPVLDLTMIKTKVTA